MSYNIHMHIRDSSLSHTSWLRSPEKAAPLTRESLSRLKPQQKSVALPLQKMTLILSRRKALLAGRKFRQYTKSKRTAGGACRGIEWPLPARPRLHTHSSFFVLPFQPAAG